MCTLPHVNIANVVNWEASVVLEYCTIIAWDGVLLTQDANTHILARTHAHTHTHQGRVLCWTYTMYYYTDFTSQVQCNLSFCLKMVAMIVSDPTDKIISQGAKKQTTIKQLADGLS